MDDDDKMAIVVAEKRELSIYSIQKKPAKNLQYVQHVQFRLQLPCRMWLVMVKVTFVSIRELM
jgi:hypothetical protein